MSELMSGNMSHETCNDQMSGCISKLMCIFHMTGDSCHIEFAKAHLRIHVRIHVTWNLSDQMTILTYIDYISELASAQNICSNICHTICQTTVTTGQGKWNVRFYARIIQAYPEDIWLVSSAWFPTTRNLGGQWIFSLIPTHICGILWNYMSGGLRWWCGSICRCGARAPSHFQRDCLGARKFGSSEGWKHLETRGKMWDTNHEALNIQMRGW